MQEWHAAHPGYQRAYARRWREQNLSYYRDYYAANLAKPQIQRTCEECGDTFATARRDQRFCGEECGHRWHRRESEARKTPEERWNDRRRANYQARRARKRTGQGEPISLDYIRERDQNRCGICGKAVSTKPYPHPLSASLDHIVPLSEGGAHDLTNVQLAHLRCNLKKGARGGGEQLMLCG